MAIIIAETDDEALKLKRLAILVAMILAGFMWTVLLIGGQEISALTGSQGLGVLIFLLPLALLSVAIQNITDYHAARLGEFRLLGIVSALQALATNLARVVGGLWSPAAIVLIVVTTLAPMVKSAMLLIGSRRMRLPPPVLAKSDALRLLKKYRDFPVYRSPTDFLNAASQAVPVIFLSSLFSPSAAGLYILTRSILNLPTNVLSAAVGSVIYARFGELQRSGLPLLPLLLKSTLALLCLAPIIIAAAQFAPPLFVFAFGEEWKEAGYYAQWMALWLGVSLANMPAVRTAPVIKAQRILLIANIAFLGVRTLAIFLVAHGAGSALQAVAAYSIASLFANIALVAVLFLACARHDSAQLSRR